MLVSVWQLAEVIARLTGRWGIKDPASETIDKWIEANPITFPEELRTKALKSIDRILGEDSELPELWEGDAEWLEKVNDLRARVSG